MAPCFPSLPAPFFALNIRFGRMATSVQHFALATLRSGVRLIRQKTSRQGFALPFPESHARSAPVLCDELHPRGIERRLDDLARDRLQFFPR